MASRSSSAARRKRGADPVRRAARSSRSGGRVSTSAPASAAIAAAAASACWAAIPPCLIGKEVASPAANTPSRPFTRWWSSVGMKPPAPRGTPGRYGTRSSGSATTRSTSIGLTAVQHERPAPGGARHARGHHPHAGVLEQLADEATGAFAEHLEWRALVGDQRPLHLPAPQRRRVCGREQRELVQRQRPAGLGVQSEGHAAHVAAAHLLEQLAERPHVGRSAERERTVHRLHRRGAHGQQQRVVAQRAPTLGVQPVALRLHGGDAVTKVVGAVGGGQVAHVDPSRMGEAEGLGHRQRAVGEVALGLEQLHVHARSGQPVERQQRLEPGHAAAGYEHAQGALALAPDHLEAHLGSSAGSGGSTARTYPRRGRGHRDFAAHSCRKGRTPSAGEKLRTRSAANPR